MGRRKINIVPIEDDRSRQVTFTKRKNGLMKKAMELSVLCNCRIGLILFDGNGRLHDFTTEDMRSLVSDYFAKELYEANTKEELYRRYNAKEAVQAAANQAAALYEDRKAEVLSGDAERTDETVVDVESNSDINNMDISRASSTHTGQKIDTRRNLRSNVQPPNRERSHAHDTRRVVVARPCDSWSSFPAQPASYVQGSAFSGGLDQGAVYNCSRVFKEEPYSAPQQILRLEDNPAFLMSIPRPENDGLYGMPVPSLGQQDCAQRPEQRFVRNAPPTSCSVCVLNPEGGKILDVYGNLKHLPLTPTLVPSSAGRMVSGPTPQEMPSIPGHPTFPFFDCLADGRHAHLGGLQPFSVENTLTQNAYSDAPQDAMCLQNLFRSGTTSYNFPSTASHNSQS